MKLLMTWEDIGTDHPEVPAKILLSRPPPRVGVSSVRFFFSLALSGFARSGLGVLVLVFSSFFLSSFAFPVSRPG